MMRGLVVLMAIASLPASVSAQSTGSAQAAVPAQAGVPVQAGVPPQDAAASKGHALQGVVRDAKGEPVAGALIEVRLVKQGAVAAADFEAAPAKSMHSGKDGRWAMQDLAAGNWLVTAMANADPAATRLGDAELSKLARPGVNFRTPAGLALTRVLRQLAVGSEATTETVELALALGPLPERPLVGQLVGAFDPGTCGYEVHVNRGSSLQDGGTAVTTVIGGGGGGVVTETTTVAGKTTVVQRSAASLETFTQVPDRDGLFDFGALEVSGADQVSVVSIPLTDAGGSVGDTIFEMPILAFEPWQEGIEIPLTAQRMVTLRATTAEGKPVTVADAPNVAPPIAGLPANARITPTMEFRIWSADGEKDWWDPKSSTQRSLGAGSYFAQARMGELASAIVPLTVEATGGTTDLSLVLQPCPPFTVHFVDAKGAPLPKAWISVGIEASRSLGALCQIGSADDGGQLTFKGVPPGTYDVTFSIHGREPFTRTLELKPDGAPVVVSMP